MSHARTAIDLRQPSNLLSFPPIGQFTTAQQPFRATHTSQVAYELDLGCDICAACGHVVTERALHSAVEWTENGASGVFLHDDGNVGGHLAAARVGLSRDGVARKMFRDVPLQVGETIVWFPRTRGIVTSHPVRHQAYRAVLSCHDCFPFCSTVVCHSPRQVNWRSAAAVHETR